MIKSAVALVLVLACFFGASAEFFQNETEPAPAVGLNRRGTLWAVLVAGSSGYKNYRHQADVLRAYQILRTHGVPRQNIITLMYDDIAHNRQNPTPGVVVNEEGGPNVYRGVQIDYRGESVTPEIFLAVLRGDSRAVRGRGSGRVVRSRDPDHIFVNFAGHGNVGFLGFPRKVLYSSQLQQTLRTMFAQRKFGKMVFYVEACESGSMFAGFLPKNMNIFAMTAASPRENSYSCCWDGRRHAFLGDAFSVTWMRDTEHEDLNRCTIQKQYEIVRNRVRTSHVQEYGDMAARNMVLAGFFGNKRVRKNSLTGDKPENLFDNEDLVSAEDVPLETLYRMHETTRNSDILFLMDAIKKTRRAVNLTINMIVNKVAEGQPPEIVDKYFSKNSDTLHENNRFCYESTIDHFHKQCFKINEDPYVGGQLYVFLNMCSAHDTTNIQQIREAITASCEV